MGEHIAGSEDEIEILVIATVHIYGGVFSELRTHDSVEAADEYARQTLGPEAVTDEAAREEGGDYYQEIFVIGIRRGQEEIRYETWVSPGK